jgi:aminopeptidase N
MRILFTLLFLAALQAIAQQPASFTQQINEIAKAEQLRHQRLSPQGTPGTADILNAVSNFDAKYYRCEWEVDPAVRYIKGKVTVYYTVTVTGTSISLDLMSPLVADSVKQRNTLLTTNHSNNILQINFSATVNAGTLDSVSIYYQGIPPTTGFGSFIQSSHAGTPVMWSLSEPYGARDWWPCKNGLNDKADSIDILITAPAQYKAASNGMLQSETLIEGGTKKTAYWKHRYPIATYLVCFAVTNYTVFNNTIQLGNTTLPMQTYCYPESLASFQSGTQNTLNAMQIFYKLFGDYPFSKEKYGHVQFGWGGGMEHQTASFIVSIVDYLTAHELAHQWFGDKITCGSWEDIWLNEGFATQLTLLYFENKIPFYTGELRRDNINTVTSEPNGSVKVDDTTNVSRIFNSRLSYTKGAMVLNMLRWKMGDSAYFKAIRAYQNDPKLAYNFARTADLKKHLEQVYGKDLTGFFNDWYSGQGYPTYNVEWTPVGSSHVKIKMNQTQSHSSVNFFELPVALKFKNATQQKTIVLDNTANGQQFFENIGFAADSVFIDPDYWLISKNNTAVKIADNAAQNTVQVYPNPIQSQFAVYFRNMTAANAKITLYNAAGQLLSTQQITLINGSQYIEVPSAHLPAGAYTLRIVTPDFKYTKKLLK